MSSKTIATILTMQDRMSPKLFGVSKNVTGMSKEMKRAAAQSSAMANKFGKNMMSMGDKIVKTAAKFVAFGAIAAAGIIFKVGIDGLKELDGAAAKVKSIAQGALEKKNIKVGLLKTSNATGIKTGELGDTQYNAISSGVKPNASLEAAVVSAKLAKAGFTDSNSALKVLMATMNVYGKTGTKAMESISDKMLVVQNLGVITVAEMAESMGSVTPVAQAAGASIDELDAGMIALTKNGIKADEASVQLKGIFTSIIKPSSEAAKEAKKLGINFSAAGLKSKGFAKFMAEVKQKTGGSTEKMAKLFGNVRALTGSLVLSGVGFKDFNSGLAAVKNSSGATESAFKIMENTIGGKMEKLKNRFKNACTSIVDTQSGTLGKIADSIGKWIVDNEGNIQKWTDNVGKAMVKIFDNIKKVIDFIIEHRTAIANFGIAFMSFYVAIKAVLAFSAALKALGVIAAATDGLLKMTTIGWIVIAVAAVIFAGIMLYKNWDKIKAAAISLWNKTKEVFSGIWESISSTFTNIWTTIKDVSTGIWNTITGIFTAIWTTIVNIFTAIKDTILNIVSAIWGTITNIFTAIKDTIVNILTSIWNVIVAILTPIFRIYEAIFKGILAVTIIVFYAIWGVIKTVWTSIWGVISSVLTAIWNVITSVWNSIVTVITTILTAIWTVMTTIWNSTVTTVTAVVTAIWAVISSVFSTIFGVVSSIFTSVWNVATSIWTSISTTISGVVTGIWTTVTVGFNSAKDSIVGIFTSIKDTVLNIFGSIWDGIKGIINGGIGLMNGFIGGVNKVVSKANKVPGVNIGAVGEIPKFAKGGIATQPSIFGEAGDEIAIPLKKTARSKALVEQADSLINGGKNDGKAVIINNYFSGNVGTEEFFDECGNHISSKVMSALTNM